MNIKKEKVFFITNVETFWTPKNAQRCKPKEISIASFNGRYYKKRKKEKDK